MTSNNLQPITQEYYFKNYGNLHGYMLRWPYHKVVLETLSSLPMSSCLELGPGACPIVFGSDRLDIRSRHEGITHVWDMTTMPWPIEDKTYDVVIGLQVWEHLDGLQKEAFEEIRRISYSAILSFPYLWKKRNSRSSRQHWGITKEKIKEWTSGYPAFQTKIAVHEEEKQRKRIVYGFKF